MISYFQNGGHDDISHRKVLHLLSAHATFPGHVQQRLPVPDHPYYVCTCYQELFYSLIICCVSCLF